MEKHLNKMLEGIAGHISENGDCRRYWDQKDVDAAVKALRDINPEASSLQYF
jgi:hypothetical protein